MLAVLPLIIAAQCCCCRFEPYAPSTSRAVESGWGEPWNGLSILAATDADTVDVGATVRVEIFLRFEPFQSDGRVGVLVADRDRERLSLTLQDRSGLPVYMRYPLRWGMRVIRRDDIELRYGAVGSRSEPFYLLSPDGSQVPSGDYLVHVTYANPGEDSLATREEPRRAPGVVWRGAVRTAAFPLHVRTKAADTTRCALPTHAVFKEWMGQLAWQWDRNSFEPTVLISRPGYYLASETTVSASIDSTSAIGPVELRTDVASTARSPLGKFQVLEGIPRPSESWVGAAGPGFRELLTGGRRLRIDFHVTIFETAQPGGRQGPGSATSHVLRDYKIVETWP